MDSNSRDEDAVSEWQVDVEATGRGRWHSLRDPTGRHWLLRRTDPSYARARPEQTVVDIGGLEECFPTIDGHPDCQDVWARPRHTDGDALVTDAAGCQLRRTLRADEKGVAEYRVFGPPGQRFLWAAHAVRDVGAGARFIAPESWPVSPWPDYVDGVRTNWPRPFGISFDRRGPDDGSPMFVALPDLTEITVLDGNERLRIRIDVDGHQPMGIGMWRNLGADSRQDGPHHRGIAVEPMLGYAFNEGHDAPDVAVIPKPGQLAWRLIMDNG